MHPRTVIPLLSLLAAACATGSHPATRFGPADAEEVRFSRVSPQSVTVQLARPAHVAFVELKPGADEVAEWVDGAAAGALQPGPHTVALPGLRGPAARNPERTACNRPGERPFYDLSIARTVAGAADIRLIRSRGRTLYCVRQPSASRIPARRARHVLVLVSPRPVDAGVLERARGAFNQRYGGSPFDGEALARALSQAVAGEWPGSAAYYVSVPVRPT